LDAALVTLRTCRSLADLVGCACELAVQACAADGAALGRVTGETWLPWLRSGRPDSLERVPTEPVLLADAESPEAEAVLAGRTVMRSLPDELAVAPIAPHNEVTGLLHVVGADLCANVVDSYASALSSMFALVDVRRRVDEQHYALARLRHSLIDGGERPIELVDAGLHLRGMRPSETSARVSSSALRAKLTARQSEVLDLMMSGLSNAEMAERLVVSVPTIKSHVRAVLRASGAVNRSEAVARFSRPDAAQSPGRSASAVRS
jgi:DNA-binding CsgD family transcriptional regulator